MPAVAYSSPPCCRAPAPPPQSALRWQRWCRSCSPAWASGCGPASSRRWRCPWCPAPERWPCLCRQVGHQPGHGRAAAVVRMKWRADGSSPPSEIAHASLLNVLSPPSPLMHSLYCLPPTLYCSGCLLCVRPGPEGPVVRRGAALDVRRARPPRRLPLPPVVLRAAPRAGRTVSVCHAGGAAQGGESWLQLGGGGHRVVPAAR